ncbi:MAG TPA: ABC transporter ATP-binding protein [Casimicrobiaceae bacterium]|nr:ABC transporter ATP-binding protein [Casimicrobiaceae bacterium]
MKLQPADLQREDRPAVGTLELYASVWRYAAGARGRYMLAMLMLAGSQAVKLLAPWLAGRAIDTVQTSGTEHLGLAALITAAIFLVYVLAWSMHGPGRIIERNVGLRVRAAVADALYAKLASLPLAWHEAHHSADMQQRARQASLALSDFAQSQFVYLQNFVNVIGPLVALSLMSSWTGVIAALGYIAVALVIIRFDRQILRLVHRQNVLERRYTVRMLDFLGNIGTVLSLRLQNVSRRLVGERLLEAFEPTRKMIALTEAKWCAVDLLTVGLSWLLVAVYVWRVRVDATAGAPLLLGGLFMVYQYAQQAGGVIGSMAANLQNFSRFRADYASAEPIWNATVPLFDGAPVKQDWRVIRAHGVEFSHVRADGSRAGIRDIDITLRCGDRIALIGPSGGGKSTLLRVLAGLYDAQRARYDVDGEAAPGARSLASISTLIPQETEIFEATLRENLTFGIPRTEQEIERVAWLSVLDAVANSLPQQWNMPLSERGINLSGGQRQRLSLARGLLAGAHSSLLLLDEPTSALDQATEAAVFERLRTGLPNVCLIASIHRLAALVYFDRVIVMADGRVVDSGTVAEILERQPAFREVVYSAAHTAVPPPQPARTVH